MNETKAKRKLSGKILGWILCISVLIGCSIGMVSYLDQVYQNPSYGADDINLDELMDTNYALYFRTMQERNSQIDTPVKAFYDLTEKHSELPVEDSFNSYVYHYDTMLADTNTIHYLVYDNTDGSMQYSKDDRDQLLDRYYTSMRNQKAGNIQEIVKKMQEEFLYYSVIYYDNKGNPMVTDNYGRSREEIESTLSLNIKENTSQLPMYQKVENDFIVAFDNVDEDRDFDYKGKRYRSLGVEDHGEGIYYRYYDYEKDDTFEQLAYQRSGYADMKPISNVTIVMGIERTGAYTQEENPFFLNGYRSVSEGFIYLLIAFLVAVIVISVVAVSIRALGISESFLTYLPMELIIAMGTGIALVTPLLEWITRCHAGGIIREKLIQSHLNESLAMIFDDIFIYGGWFLYAFLIFAALVALLSVFHKGIRRFLYENSLIFHCGHWLLSKIKCGITKVVEFDYQEPVNRYVLKVVAINFLVIAIMCSIWFFGIPVLIIYSFVIFYLLQRYLNDLKKKYDTVLTAAEKIAKGELECKVQENVGVFAPIACELNQIKDGFQHAVNEEVKSQQMRNELITNVSHDLKTPLTAIITYVNLLQEGNLTKEQQKEYIDTLNNKAMRLKQLIEDLFEVSKLNSRNITLDPVDVDVVELIKQAQLEIAERFKEAQIEFRLSAPEEKIILTLDSQKTYRVFENLFVNVIKYALPGTRAYMDVFCEKGCVKIALKNISAQELNVTAEQLTERFVRGDESRHAEGSGLGLAIVKSIVEVQGGKFYLEIDGDLFKAVIEFKSPESNITK